MAVGVREKASGRYVEEKQFARALRPRMGCAGFLLAVSARLANVVLSAVLEYRYGMCAIACNDSA